MGGWGGINIHWADVRSLFSRLRTTLVLAPFFLVDELYLDSLVEVLTSPVDPISFFVQETVLLEDLWPFGFSDLLSCLPLLTTAEEQESEPVAPPLHSAIPMAIRAKEPELAQKDRADNVRQDVQTTHVVWRGDAPNQTYQSFDTQNPGFEHFNIINQTNNDKTTHSRINGLRGEFALFHRKEGPVIYIYI